MNKLPSIRVPLLGGRLAYLPKAEDAAISAKMLFATRLYALHRDKHGHLILDNRNQYEVTPQGYDLGSGLVTNVGVQAMALDYSWPQNVQTLKLANNHASGTGTTAAAATDIALQTSAGPSPVAGTQSNASVANTAKYQSVATLAYTSTLAITEWGLHSSATLSATTGSPFTATSSTSGTATGTPYTASSASAQGETGLIVKAGTTAVYGLIVSNTSSVLTIVGWWSTTTGAAGSTPGSTEAFTLLPVMWDHKVFSAINVVSGDSIQFTYDLTVNSGG